MRRIVGIVAAMAALLAGCGSDPAPAADAPSTVVATSPSTTATSMSPAPSSAPAVDPSVTKACASFRDALAAVPDSDIAEPEGHFLAKLESARGGGEFSPTGFSMWLSNYSAAYLPASVPDELRTPIETVAGLAKSVTDGSTAKSMHLLTDQDAKALVAAYSDAADQCEAAGEPLGS